MGSKTRQWIMFNDGYIDSHKNRLEKGTKYTIRSQDTKYFYINKCKVDKSIDKSLYEIGEINSG